MKSEVKYEFKKIIKETPKAWQLEMSGGAIHWLSKRLCRIESNIVILPWWLDSLILWKEIVPENYENDAPISYKDFMEWRNKNEQKE